MGRLPTFLNKFGDLPIKIKKIFYYLKIINYLYLSQIFEFSLFKINTNKKLIIIYY